MDDEDDDLPDDSFDPMSEPTYRSQLKYYGVPKMVKTSCGEVVVGTIINETYCEIELKWPLQLFQTSAKINGETYPVMFMTRYATGTFEEFVTFNKEQLIFWNDTDETVDEYYTAQLKKIYPTAEKQLIEDQRKVYPSDEDKELESLVTKYTVGKPVKNLQSMIDLMTGISKKQAPPESEPED